MLYSFEKLRVYQTSRVFVRAIYQLTSKFPNHEKFGISSQLRRASVSISSNIAEGSGKTSSKEQAHFTNISYASLMEVYCQLQICLDLGYITSDEYEDQRTTISLISNQLSSLRRSQLRRKTNP